MSRKPLFGKSKPMHETEVGLRPLADGTIGEKGEEENFKLAIGREGLLIEFERRGLVKVSFAEIVAAFSWKAGSR